VGAGNPTMYTDSYITHRQSSLRVRYHQFNIGHYASTPITYFWMEQSMGSKRFKYTFKRRIRLAVW
jgi:hypothetical protein